MRIDIVTIFPQMFKPVLSESIIKRAQEKGLVEINVYNLRDYADSLHRQVDDAPFGGGPGMVMKPEPFFDAVLDISKSSLKNLFRQAKVVLLTPQGTSFNQKIASKLSKEKRLILLCPRYEGVDERVRKHLATYEISVGDYVLSGGELPAMVLIDAVVRLIPKVLGDVCSSLEESFSEALLEYPQYTRPRTYLNYSVPKVLLSGNHEEIAKWRRKKSLERTFIKRPDLLKKAKLTSEDKKALKGFKKGLPKRKIRGR